MESQVFAFDFPKPKKAFEFDSVLQFELRKTKTATSSLEGITAACQVHSPEEVEQPRPQLPAP